MMENRNYSLLAHTSNELCLSRPCDSCHYQNKKPTVIIFYILFIIFHENTRANKIKL